MIQLLTYVFNLIDSSDLWSFNISSGNWTFRGGVALLPSIGGVGWPGSLSSSGFCQNSISAFIFGGISSCMYSSSILISFVIILSHSS